MAKKLGKILLLTAAAGSAAAAAYYFMQKKTASQTAASEDEDYDDFTAEDEEPKNSHTYVPLTPDAKNNEAEETASGAENETAVPDTQGEVAACAQDPQNQDCGDQDSSGQDSAFTPLFQQLSQTADAEEETIEEFFNEDTEDTEAPEKAE